MRLVCETVVKDVLPSIRSLIAKELKDRGYTQTEIAELLDITQPAVSQYLSKARGAKVQRIEDHDASYERVTGLVDMLLEGRPDEELAEEFCETCIAVRDAGLFEAGFDGSEDMAAECRLRNPN